MPANIHDLSIAELEALALSWGLKPFVTDQILLWLYNQKIDSFEQMKNVSKELRAKLQDSFQIGTLVAETVLKSQDGSKKFLFKLVDGNRIESVLMPQNNGRLTLCVSTQVGCAMKCDFCRTGEMGLLRNLSTGEILEQVLGAGRGAPKITNIVFMGMGEPLHNFDNVIKALQILRDERAFNFGKRKITVSTVGLVPQIEKFGEKTDVKLAISLNGSDDVFRTGIMPVNKKYPMEALQEACRKYNDLTGQVITIEYVMFADLNDKPEDAKRLVGFLSKIKAKVNLIPFNEYPGSPYKRPTEAALRAFHHRLADKNFQVNVRYSKGLDISGACGQLATTA